MSSSFPVGCRDVIYCVLVEFVGQLYIIFHLSYIFVPTTEIGLCCGCDMVEGFVASELGLSHD